VQRLIVIQWVHFCLEKSGELPHFSAPNVTVVVQALCAGGDVKQVVLDAEQGNWQRGVEYFRKHSTVDYLVSRLADGNMTNGRPCIAQVAVMDGIVFGGGVALSMHGPFRIATERYDFKFS
jgi:enoyl-CoA hydratase/carnithine racemase